MINKLCSFCHKVRVKTKNRKFCSHSCYAKSLVGHKQPKSQIDKRIKSLTGQKRTLEQRKKLSESQKGIKKVVKHDKQFKKGHIPWIKGRTHSEETRKKIGLASKGNTFFKGKKHSFETRKKMSASKQNISLETRKAISASKQGIALDEWNGFSTSSNRLERKRFRREIQKKVFERDNYTCQICGIRGGYLQVDHIQSWADYIELRFEMKNLRTLCMDCHYFITFGKNKPDNVIWGHNLKHAEIRG